MKELYIQGKGKIDCETILSALFGLGADPEKIRERLESAVFAAGQDGN